MNVYDFDGTILNGDSELYFFDYVIKHKLLRPRKLKMIKHNLEIETRYNFLKTRGKIYKSFRKIKNLENELEKFWDEHMKDIKPYYLKQQKKDDVISSATPDFLLIPIIKRLNNPKLIATKFDLKKFEIIGKYNWKEEKVNRFREIYPTEDIEEFYSDSINDIYLAKLAKHAFLVKGNTITDYFND